MNVRSLLTLNLIQFNHSVGLSGFRSVSVGLCRTLSDSVGLCRTLSDSVGLSVDSLTWDKHIFCRNSVELCRIPVDVCRLTTIYSVGRLSVVCRSLSGLSVGLSNRGSDESRTSVLSAVCILNLYSCMCTVVQYSSFDSPTESDRARARACDRVS